MQETRVLTSSEKDTSSWSSAFWEMFQLLWYSVGNRYRHHRKKGCIERLPLEAYTDPGSHADSDIWRGHSHRMYMQGNPSVHTRSKQICRYAVHEYTALQQVWRICQCTHLLCRGRERTHDMGLCCKVRVLLLSSPESATCSWNKQLQTSPKFDVSSFLWTATLHRLYFTIQALCTQL